jgi:hypothetical protein
VDREILKNQPKKSAIVDRPPARLCPDTLPYELGTSAAFEVASFNGRALGDDALDVMMTLATNTPLVDGLAPDRVRIRKDFPYYGAPYTTEEQVG